MNPTVRARGGRNTPARGLQIWIAISLTDRGIGSIFAASKLLIETKPQYEN
jgi:hypothetical protein